MTLTQLAAGLLPILLLPPLDAADFSATVLAVLDGDTLTVLLQERTVRVRLSGVDSPEKNQPFGQDALAFTAELALGRTATIREQGIDRYGRLVAAVVLPDGRSLNHEIVAAGLAWWDREFAPGNRMLEALEAGARSQRRGLWAAGEPIAPWQWRRQDHRPVRADQARSERRSQRRDTGRSRQPRSAR